MKKLVFILALLIALPGFAKEKKVTKRLLRPQFYEDIEKSANQLRAQEKEIRQLFMQLVLRKVQMDTVAIMQKNNMSEEDIQKVLASDEMKKFLERLEQNPKIKARVEHHVQKLVAPGVIETHVLKQRAQLAKEMHQNLVLAQNEINKAATFNVKEKVFKPEEKNFLNKVWDGMVADLYKD